MDQPRSEIDPRRVRVGLAIVTVVFLVALVLLIVIDDGLGKLLMGAVVIFSIVRAWLLRRSVRRDHST